MYCPHCGKKISDPPAGKFRSLARAYSGYRSKRITTMASTSLTPWQPAAPDPGASVPAFASAERRTPYRPQNLESDFLTPLMQALGTGAFVSASGVYLAWLYPGVFWYHGLALGVVAAGGYWLLALGWNRNLLWTVERIIGADLDQDGDIGAPEPAPVRLEVTHTNEAGRFSQLFRFDLPDGLTEADFQNFARGVTLEGRGLAESQWTGSGKPFSKPKYGELLEVLTQAGLVRWKNDKAPAQGRELTGSGRMTLRNFAYGASTHTQAPDVVGDLRQRYTPIG